MGGSIPGKKRAVLGRDVAFMEFHLVKPVLYTEAIILCRVRKALCVRWGQQLPGLFGRKVGVSCFIA